LDFEREPQIDWLKIKEPFSQSRKDK